MTGTTGHCDRYTAVTMTGIGLNFVGIPVTMTGINQPVDKSNIHGICVESLVVIFLLFDQIQTLQFVELSSD